MHTHLFRLLSCCLLLACVAGVAETLHADHTFEVGTALARNPRPNAPSPSAPFTTEVQTGDMNGVLSVLTLKNQTRKDATDWHIRIASPPGAVVHEATVHGSRFGPAEGEDTSTVGGYLAPNENPLPNGESLKLSLSIRDKDDQPLNNTKVKLEIWWTTGSSLENSEPIARIAPDSIGNSDEGEPLSTLEIPDFDNSIVTFEEEALSVGLNDIAVAERFNERFEEGELVFRLDSGLRFESVLGVSVLAYHESGDEATISNIIFGSLRLNADGAIVLPVQYRDATDSEHLVIVLRGAVIANTEDLREGQTIYVGVGCSAVGGRFADSFWEVAKPVAP